MNKIILVNKEKNWTSRDVVNFISKKFNNKKVGHFGTLDPLATGLLVIGIGSFTKVGNLFTYDTKEYICEVLLGVSTNTYDVTGDILRKENFNVTKEELETVLNSFKKTYNQEVPIYSAVKVNGKKLYEYARNNEEVDLPKKEVTIYDIAFLDLYNKDDNTYFRFKCKVSKGTYIRSLINDISKELNIPMCMSNLQRIKQDKLSVNDSYTIEDIKNDNYRLLNLEDIFDIQKIEIEEKLEKKIINGSLIDNIYNKDKIIFTKNNNNFVLYTVYEKDKTKLKPFLFY